jgi:hypothetical protein
MTAMEERTNDKQTSDGHDHRIFVGYGSMGANAQQNRSPAMTQNQEQPEQGPFEAVHKNVLR